MNTLAATFEHDAADIFLGNNPTLNSTDSYLDDAASFFHHNSQTSDDTESISEDSRKIRKKRNTYHKISDDIRIELLDAVNKGETLKSAAKRYNINYSSAKSILHTYRREGRILKKSAQERTAKKKTVSSEEVTSPVKNVKEAAKKKNPRSLNDCDFLQEALPYTERTASMTTCASIGDDNSPASSGMNYNENFSSYVKQETRQANRKASIEQPMVNLDSYFASQSDSYYTEAGAEYFGETYNQSNNIYHNEGMDSFHHLMNAFQRKPSLNTDDFFNDSNTFLYPRGVTPVNSQGNNAFKFDNNESTQFNSFLETQDLLKQALRKTSMSYNGGYRKSSFDMF